VPDDDVLDFYNQLGEAVRGRWDVTAPIETARVKSVERDAIRDTR
jgi:hypothetical protein